MFYLALSFTLSLQAVDPAGVGSVTRVLFLHLARFFVFQVEPLVLNIALDDVDPSFSVFLCSVVHERLFDTISHIISA